MPISPSIPTSFVPKQPVEGGRRRGQSGGNNIFLIISLIIFGLSLLAAGGVFGYLKLIQAQTAQKGQELETELAHIDQAQIQDYVRLHQRIEASKTLLSNHIALSQLLIELEDITIPNVRFNMMSVAVADDRTAKMSMTGNAKSFNALAVESSQFAATKNHFKRAIFSGITVNPKDGTISFTVTADVDPALIIFNASTTPVTTVTPEPVVAVPVATSTTPVTVGSTTPKP